MASQELPDLSNALLAWIRALAPSSAPESLHVLRDGHLLWSILCDIDPSFFSDATLPSSETETSPSSAWIPRWQNLKHIDREVDAYVRDICGVDAAAGGEGGKADLKKVAQSADKSSEEELTKLLKGILRAAMYSPASNQRMGRVLVGLGSGVAGTIAAAMAAMEQGGYTSEEEQGGSGVDEEAPTPSRDELETAKRQVPGSKSKEAERDIELEHEEQLINAHRIIRQLEESNAKATSELQELREEKDKIEVALKKLQDDQSDGTGKRSDEDAYREFRDRNDQDRDYIAQLETELETSRTTTENQARQLERLKASSEASQRMKDDLQLLRAERDELLSKTRANENLRKKIQNLQDESKGFGTIREDLKLAREQLAEMEKWKERCERLETTNRENMNILANTEQEIFDMRTTRKRLEHELRVLSQRYDVVRDRQARDQEMIQELEAKLGQLGGEEVQLEKKEGLDSEMDKVDLPKPQASRAVNMTAPGSGDVAMLEERLRVLSLRNKSLEEQFLDILTDKLGLETTLAEVNDGSKGNEEEQIPYLEQRKKLIAATEDVRQLQENVYNLTSELATTKEKLLSVQDRDTKGSKSPTSKEKTGQLDGEAEYSALSKSYSGLAKHSENLEVELAESKALLRYALLSARGIGIDSEKLRKTQEFQLVKQLLEEVQKSEGDQAVDDVGRRIVSRIEDARSQGSGTSGELDKAKAELQGLRQQMQEMQAAHAKQLEAAKGEASQGGAGGVTKAEEKAMAQLKRENQLMTTAWFDLASRIQKDNVVVTRRREDPKSWLGKQRAAIGLGVTGLR